MGFWSGLVKVAKVAAPIALAATGVGAPLAMAAKGGLDALDAKMSGKGWKGALGAGALGAATGAIPGMGAAKGVAGGVAGAAKAGAGSALKSAFTNPATLASIASSVGSGLASGMEKDRGAKNLAAEQAAAFKLREAQGAEQATQGRADLELRQKQLAADELRKNYQSALRSAFAKNVQDVNLSGVAPGVPVVNFGGGARPSALGAEGRQAAGLMFDKSLAGMRDGTSFSALPALERVSPAAHKGAGLWENVLGGVGMAGRAYQGVQDQQNAQENTGLLQSILAKLQDTEKEGVVGAQPPATPVVPQTSNPALWGGVRF